MEAHSDVRRSLFPLGFTVTFSARLPVSVVQSVEFTDRVLRGIVPRIVYSGGAIDDVKGCDGAFLAQHFPEASAAAHERLVYLSGAVDPLDEDDAEAIPFVAEIGSEFKEFVGNHHIRHALHSRITAPEVESIPIDQFGRTVPIAFREAIISLDLFRTMIFTRMLGFSPAVTESIAFHLTPGRVALVMHADGLTKRNERPLQRHGLFQNTCCAMKEALGIDLERVYLESVG